ncbi:MAG: polymer-forming cytoskeletal protein [Chitinispirillales bacterium]|jgi:cytoskeletal protein CcmA (bactofilin family)|nr:polymer-forming cytoskeletal protein [Chitinispirillales bacterium]
MGKNVNGLLNIIGSGCVFDGVISAPHSIRIDGTFRGKIQTAGTITVGETGQVEAEIKAQNALVFGKVIGNMYVEERVELHTSAVVTGDLRAKELVIKEGVTYNGNCSMKTGKEPPAAEGFAHAV